MKPIYPVTQGYLDRLNEEWIKGHETLGTLYPLKEGDQLFGFEIVIVEMLPE